MSLNVTFSHRLSLRKSFCSMTAGISVGGMYVTDRGYQATSVTKLDCNSILHSYFQKPTRLLREIQFRSGFCDIDRDLTCEWTRKFLSFYM